MKAFQERPGNSKHESRSENHPEQKHPEQKHSEPDNPETEDPKPEHPQKGSRKELTIEFSPVDAEWQKEPAAGSGKRNQLLGVAKGTSCWEWQKEPAAGSG